MLHLRVGAAGRQPSSLLGGIDLLDRLGHPPNIMLAPHLAAMTEEPLLKRQPVGMLFVAGATADEWNAGLKLQNAPLAGLSRQALETISGHISTSYTTNAAKSLARPWLVEHNTAEVHCASYESVAATAPRRNGTVGLPSTGR
jgi:hypothetical protein